MAVGRTRVGALLLSITMLAGCDPAFGGGGGGGGGESAEGGGGDRRSGCTDAGPLTRDFLPQFPTDEVRQVVNPCLGLKDLPSLILDLIPDGQRSGIGTFIAGLRGIAAKALAIGDLVECGYETDRLAIGVYQDRRTQWSVGVAVVTRGRVDALVAASKCFLLKQIPFKPRATLPASGADPEPEPTFCAESRHRTRAGERYTVLWLGSSDTMCAKLEVQLRAGEPVDGAYTATVKALPDVAVRTGPSTSDTRKRREPAGQILIVACYKIGERVDGRRGGSDRWYRLDGDEPEFVAGAWLDTGDNPEKPPRCR